LLKLDPTRTSSIIWLLWIRICYYLLRK
jgi:hypothetical protein